ncbi:hypothetical protein SVAN01_01814 [Stagonosporopsis vannaccii]|nr:hypothetical protein SVAN01_01814 [Stagonosporopsis vannaccii]
MRNRVNPGNTAAHCATPSQPRSRLAQSPPFPTAEPPSRNA